MKKFSSIFCLAALPGLILAGCGTGVVVEGTAASHASESCISCKRGITTTSWSGPAIVGEWERSAHALKGGAGCADCHGTSFNHGGASTCASCHGGGSSRPVVDADLQGKCNGCHDRSRGFGVSTVDGVTLNSAIAHFSNISASYVSSRNRNRCRNCHNPHALDRMDVLRDWARSGHGKTDAAPWKSRDFKTIDTCNRCHTTTGFVKYLTTGDTSAWGTSSDPTREVLGCPACHSDYRYTLRQAGQVTAPYTNAPETYPNAGRSNLCLNCHVGRESGTSIKNSFANFTSTSFINSHYLTAGGSVFGKTGYHFVGREYDSHVKFDQSPNDFIHDRLGREDLGAYAVSKGFSATTVSQFTNAQAYIVREGLQSAGPCVVCHMTSLTKERESSHKFTPYTDYSGSKKALNPVCVNCHTARGAGSDAKAAWYEGEWKRNMDAGLEMLKTVLETDGILFLNRYPYFFDASGSQPIKKWHVPFGFDKAKDLMGAAFNYNLLYHDPGAIAHNRMYVRRLLYDSIDFADDGNLNDSVSNSISNSGLTKYSSSARKLLIRQGGGRY